MSIYSTRKSKKQKKWTEWHAGPAKRETLPKLSTFLSPLKGDPLKKKQIFEKKSLTMPKNLKGDPLGFFNIHSVAKHQKIEGGILFSGKKLKGGTLWDFPTTILTQNTKKIEGGPFGEIFFPKSLAVPKKN